MIAGLSLIPQSGQAGLLVGLRHFSDGQARWSACQPVMYEPGKAGLSSILKAGKGHAVPHILWCACPAAFLIDANSFKSFNFSFGSIVRKS